MNQTAQPYQQLSNDPPPQSSAPISVLNLKERFSVFQQDELSGVFNDSFGQLRPHLIDLLASLERNPEGALRQGGGQGVTCRRELEGIVLYVKIYRPDRLHRRLRDLFGRKRAIRE